MNLSVKTLKILDNFCSIKNSIVIKPGNEIFTGSVSKTIFARANVAEKFDTEFAIYDLKKFLSVLSLFKECDVQIDSTTILIEGSGAKVNYSCADPMMLYHPDKTKVKMPSVDSQFILTAINFNNLIKAASALGLAYMAIEAKDKKVLLRAVSPGNPLADDYSVHITDTSSPDFAMVFELENIKFMSLDYGVQICSKGLARFFNDDVEYYVMANSKYSRFSNV